MRTGSKRLAIVIHCVRSSRTGSSGSQHPLRSTCPICGKLVQLDREIFSAIPAARSPTLAQLTYGLCKGCTELALQSGRETRRTPGKFRGAGTDQLVEHA